MKKIVTYFKESYDELVHKVSWPTYAELTSSAVAVLYASLLIALVVFVMDFCFQNIAHCIGGVCDGLLFPEHHGVCLSSLKCGGNG